MNSGQACRRVDPIFLETTEGDFFIHVTPYGNAVLYVAEIGEDYPSVNSGHRLVIRAREGRDDVEFAWLLTAARETYAGMRLSGDTADEQENAD